MSPNAHELRESVRLAYSAAASDPSAQHPFPVGPGFARDLGYPQELLKRIPDESVEAFAGISAVSLQAQLREGLTVLDMGCGAGLVRPVSMTAVILAADATAAAHLTRN